MRKNVRVLLRTLLTVFRSLSWYVTAAYIATLLGAGLLTGFTAKVTQNFFDTAASMAGVPEGFSRIVSAGVLLGGFVLASHFAEGLSELLCFVVHKLSAGPMTEASNLKTGRIDPICFDNPAFLDDIEKSASSVYRLYGAFTTTLSAVFLHLTNCAVMVWYLNSLDPVLAIMPLVVFVPIILTQLAQSSVFATMEDAAAPIRRETNYYQDCIGRREFFKETRVLGAFGYFKTLYTAALELLNRETWRAEKKSAWLDLASKLTSLAGFGLMLFLLVRSVSAGKISVGAFAAVFASIQTMFSLMERLVLQEIGWLSKGFGYIHNYFNFLDLPERRGSDTPVTLNRAIELKDISFRYPGRDAQVLKNINLTIPAGETLAVVGENGSGKSTLVKLLLGLYLPTSGTITYDGRDIKDASGGALTHKTSAVFQDYMRYKLTIKDNVAISDLATAEREGGYGEEISSLLRFTTEDPVSARSQELLNQMGIDCGEEGYPAGVNTLLDREFGGIDLSGGGWQKVAIARGLYRDHHLIALDEPTAAIDPIEESRLYHRFMEISKGVTSIIVTHRLGSVRIADRILVLDQGEIVQSGTHEELVGQPGKYAQMWQAQAQYYR